MNQTSFCEELKDKIKNIFPNHAELRVHNSEIIVSWKLRNDKARPNKRSKTIKIIITDELFEDYCEKPKDEQNIYKNNFINYIKQKYKKFNANHDAPKYQPPPIEKWVPSTHDVNR